MPHFHIPLQSGSNRILGGHVNYDGRTTANGNYFNQMTFGIESLGSRLDFRANGYIPIGTDRHQITIEQAAAR